MSAEAVMYVLVTIGIVLYHSSKGAAISSAIQVYSYQKIQQVLCAQACLLADVDESQKTTRQVLGVVSFYSLLLLRPVKLE